ncbi:MAG: invasion associated locus B family protein [Alphaproteobacteria bacterium]|nr:invasion associated locus B family protein [Alphaproteobacteria bacterium]MBV9692564.1 invasion associated locus B family protein [Alphaproteobacteria bacterium]
MNDNLRMQLTRGAIAVGIFVAGLVVGWAIRNDGSNPARISVYKDWQLSCPADEDKKGSCVLATTIVDQGQRLGQVSIGTEASDLSKHAMVVNLPLTVLIPPGFGIQIGSDTKSIPYSTCLPSGCVGTFTMDDKVLDELDSASSVGTTVTAPDGRSVTLPISVQGYKEAAKAMRSAEARRRSWWWRLWS